MLFIVIFVSSDFFRLVFILKGVFGSLVPSTAILSKPGQILGTTTSLKESQNVANSVSSYAQASIDSREVQRNLANSCISQLSSIRATTKDLNFASSNLLDAVQDSDSENSATTQADVAGWSKEIYELQNLVQVLKSKVDDLQCKVVGETSTLRNSALLGSDSISQCNGLLTSLEALNVEIIGLGTAVKSLSCQVNEMVASISADHFGQNLRFHLSKLMAYMEQDLSCQLSSLAIAVTRLLL